MWLPSAIITDVEDAVTVFYVDFTTARLWALRRDKGEPLVFCGWYWAKGPVEGGPFKTRSACYRDAWFRIVQRRTPPLLRRETNRLQNASRNQNKKNVA